MRLKKYRFGRHKILIKSK